MGIRFYCPNGHKLNVKAYLAGKRGICPECGASFLIPLESTRLSSKESINLPQPDEPMPELVTAPKPEPELPSENPITANISEGKPPSATEMSLENIESFDQTPEAEKKTESFDDFSNSQNPLDAESNTGNPILNELNVVWYIQVPDGPQYGPATGPVIQNWIKERRIGPKMLVWREGWSSWLEAQSVFPEIREIFVASKKDDPVNNTLEEPMERSEPENEKISTYTIRVDKQKQASQKMLLIIVLSVVVVVLGGVLIYLLRNNF